MAGASAAVAWESARVLGPPPGDSDWWDARCFSGAVVVKLNDTKSYRMYYYGRADHTWNMGIKPFNPNLPTGKVGLAVSTDGGRSFRRQRGPLAGGAVFEPSHDAAAFDCVHVGCSDLLSHDSTWQLYYFAGGLAGPTPGSTLLPGVASSADGVHFGDRRGPLLGTGAPGEWDERSVSWPRVFTGPAGELLMTYHTLETAGFASAGLALSADRGLTWRKLGRILTRGGPGAWDEGGVSVRHVVHIGERYVMLYEGFNKRGGEFEFSIGVALSEDGLTWRKDDLAGDEPGGPVLRARKGMDTWDNFIVATPYVVVEEDGSLKMYYLGLGKKNGREGFSYGIGLALSDCSNYRSWKRLGDP